MITAENISMRFYLGREKITNLKEYLIRRIKRTIAFDEFWALRDISFRVDPGEVYGIVGPNGAGKSTLLKIIAGVIKPTAGAIGVDGKISPLIELGSGFDFELTARENIFLNGAVLGYQKPFLRSKFHEIVEFSELLQFIDVPLKNFSSGMVARLAFSIATIVNPEVLLVDEILSMGDMRFQEKSEAKMRSMMEGGATVVFVSHNIATVRDICDKVLWLERGRIRMIGVAEAVCKNYIDAMGGQGL
ncbi:MAG: ABC transporter ATP-binding protein [Deltaproteobacteria bacterium]|nr:ABC transporter ATP-binding protein [Deltaproteobacteria bacterium]